MQTSAIKSTIIALLKARETSSSICPSEVARVLAPNNDEWRALMPEVRAVAAHLARQGKIIVTQGAITLPPNESEWRGAIRLRLMKQDAPSARPTLASTLEADEFLHWYWLKEELVAFCRASGLSTVGQKPELTKRIAALLRGVTAPEEDVPRAKRNPKAMPDSFTLKSVIGQGWSCNPRLGAFMREHCGAGFRFNADVRHFIHTQAGKTLAQAIVCYKESIARKEPTTIIEQNELNQHLRDYFAANPGATRTQAMQAWKKKRATRRAVPYNAA